MKTYNSLMEISKTFWFSLNLFDIQEVQALEK